LVTEDNCLREFNSNDVKFEPRFAAALPHLPEMFIKNEVFTSLKLKPDEDATLCKTLTVQDFVSRLSDLLPRDVFCDVNGYLPLAELFRHLKCKNIPDSWLQQVWHFFSSLMHDKKNTADIIEPLHKWLLLPAYYAGEEVVLSVGNSRCVIPMTGRTLARSLEKVLTKLGTPQPLYTHFASCGVPQLYQLLLGSLENAASVVLALEQTLLHSNLLIQGLSHDEGMTLLTYLSENFDQWRDVPNGIEIVQMLPIFQTIYGKLVSIHGSCTYVIPNRIPIKDMESWTSAQSIIFLKSADKIMKLLQYLGCKQLTETEIYCSFIFNHFELLTDEGRHAHLMHVRDKMWRELEEEVRTSEKCDKDRCQLALNALIESLRKLEFLPRSDGSLGCASDFYDPTVEVIAEFIEKSCFPPSPFSDWKWLPFLRVCGLVHLVTQEMFVEFALKVKQLGQMKVCEDVLKKSKVLVKHLFGMAEVLDGSFLQQVKEIAFIVPHCVGSVKECFHEQYGNRNDNGQLLLIPFSGSIVDSWSDCVWTVQTIIPEWANPHNHINRYSSNKAVLSSTNVKFVLEQLHIEEKPQLLKVAHHVEKLCMNLTSHSHTVFQQAALLGSVLERIYDFC
jgi:hypothetical protein